MADQAQREAMRHIDAAKRMYKTLQPTPFPSNELAVIPWVSNYEEYIRRVYGEGDAFKVAHIITHVPPSLQFCKGHGPMGRYKKIHSGINGPKFRKKTHFNKGAHAEAWGGLSCILQKGP